MNSCLFTNLIVHAARTTDSENWVTSYVSDKICAKGHLAKNVGVKIYLEAAS